MINRLCFVFGLFSIITLTQAQTQTSVNNIAQNIDPAVLQSGNYQQLQKQLRDAGVNQSASVLSQIESLKRKNGTGRDINPYDTSDQDSAIDTTDSQTLVKPIPSSVYEKIVRGNFIHPDTVLANISIFGHDVFSEDKNSVFTPNGQISVPADYPVSTGDEVTISLWGRINENHRLSVERDGSLSIPRLGPVMVAGTPFSTMQKKLTQRLETIEGVKASVNMGQLNSITIVMVGEVKSPGQYTISALSNVTNALFAAGGITKMGSLRNVELRRNGRLIKKIDMYDFLLSGNNFGNLRLKTNDVIFVPVVKGMAAIAGNVRRSALYELKNDMNLENLVSLAGGLLPAAWTTRIQVDRFKENNYREVLDLKVPTDGKLPDFDIKDGDVVRVFPVVVTDPNAVYLAGNVLRPGKYEFTEGMKITDLIQSYNDLYPETYLEYATIKRRIFPTYDKQIVSFEIGNALSDTNSTHNVELQPGDEIIVYHRDFFEPNRTIHISGAITTPGEYRLLDNMKVKDLILQAGGLTEAASTERGELYRRMYHGDTVAVEKVSFCVDCAMTGDESENMHLSKSDHVFIRAKRGWQEKKTINLKGEFVYPGEYVLLDNEDLGDVIRRAGGFTSEAYLSAAIFTRESVKQMERNRNNEYVRQLEGDISRLAMQMAAKENAHEAQMLMQQQLSLLERMRNMEAVGRVVINLEEDHSYKDFLLEDGDHIYIPKKLNTVSTIGEVFNPSTYRYDSRRSKVTNYIDLSGGLKNTADKKNIYIIKANGSVVTNGMRNVKKYRLDPGDVVVVPQRIKYVDGYKAFIDVVDALYKVSMTAAVVINLLPEDEK